MAVLLFASSLAMFSCGGGGSDLGGNKFVGTWVTSQFYASNKIVPATLSFTGSDWNLSAPNLGINERGNYVFNVSSENAVDLYRNGSKVGTAVISNGAMTVTFSLYGGSSKFTKR